MIEQAQGDVEVIEVDHSPDREPLGGEREWRRIAPRKDADGKNRPDDLGASQRSQAQGQALGDHRQVRLPRLGAIANARRETGSGSRAGGATTGRYGASQSAVRHPGTTVTEQ